MRSAEANYLANIVNVLKSTKLSVNNFVDIGCGDGSNTLLISRSINATNVYGVDFDDKYLKIANKRGITSYKRNISKSNWVSGLPKVDFVYSNQTIEHLYSVDDYIKNIRKLLKKNGHLLVSTENLSSWHNIISMLLGFQPFSLTNISVKCWSIGNPFTLEKKGHHNHLMIHRSVFTSYALQVFLKMYGFEIIRVISSGYYPLPNNILGNLFAKLDPRHSVYMAVLAKKK